MLYAHDVFHDLIEGVMPRFLCWLIKTNYSGQYVSKLNSEISKIKWNNGPIKPIDLKHSKFHSSFGMQFLEFFIQSF